MTDVVVDFGLASVVAARAAVAGFGQTAAAPVPAVVAAAEPGALVVSVPGQTFAAHDPAGFVFAAVFVLAGVVFAEPDVALASAPALIFFEPALPVSPVFAVGAFHPARPFALPAGPAAPRPRHLPRAMTKCR